MAQNEFRVTKQFKEIISILEKATTLKGGFLWQNQAESRSTIDLQVISIDPIQQKMSVEFKTDPSGLLMDEPCFVKLPIKECAFKTLIVGMGNSSAIVEFPIECVLIENRKSPRTTFRDEDMKTAVFFNPMSSDPVLSAKGQTLRVSNVSLSGISVFVTLQQSSRFEVNDHLILSALGEFRLKESIGCTVMYKIPTKKKGQFGATETGMTIGFALDTPLAADVFEQYTYSDTGVTLNDARLFKDQAYRQAIHHGMKATLSRLSEKKNLKALFQKLEIKREDNQYLKNHIELMCEVSCQIGREIGWISESNLEKLVYVSYLHDVGYFDRPYLAKVSDKRDIEYQKSRYSKDDLQVFVNGPHYAAEIAKEDNSAFPDAHKILMQQREKPDGTGFPQGIKANQMIPLSCLFMVCHEFVDYVMNDPEWSYDEFVKRNQRIYKGTYFHKVLQVFEDLK